MKTDRLFDFDPYLESCDAAVLSCRKAADRYAVILDRTVFFPAGGGQLSDDGDINGLPVLEVYEENGELLHFLPSPLEEGARVSCRIEISGRLSRMRLHSGQHILSAVISQCFGNDTLISRMEKESSHIDLPRHMTAQEVLEAEKQANDIIRQNLTISCGYYTPEEALKQSVRGKITPHDMIRLVNIDGFDTNACGGTHCRSTAEIGQVLITGAREVRGVFRIYFVAGEEAERELYSRALNLLDMQELFSVFSQDELKREIFACKERRDYLEEAARDLRARLVAADGARISAQLAFSPFLFEFQPEGDIKHLKNVCDVVLKEKGGCLLFATQNGDTLSLLFARSKGDGPNLGAYIKELAAKHAGKGGGSPVLAQGAVPFTQAALDDIIMAAEAIKSLVAEEK